MGIKGLALKNIEKLKLQSPLDLYSFSEQWFADKLGAIGPKIYKEIQSTLDINVIKLIAALNPPNIKQTMLNKIFDTYHTLDVLGDKNNLVKVQGIGEKRADALSNWYRDKFLTYLPILIKIGFNLVPEKSIIHLTIAVTGTFPMTRKNFEELMQPKGVEVKNLTKATQVLVVGEKPSESKIKKAEKYGIPVVSYFQFIQDLKNGNSES
jgi:NAD-dependent DNA ligase